MNDEDKKSLMLFIVLIALILGVFAFNMYKNKKLENIDRKVEYIFENYTYDNVYVRSSELFFQTIELIKNKDVFDYEKDRNERIKYYSIGDYNNYKKIHNFMIVTNTLAEKEVTKYMDYKKIIKHENNYYIEHYIDDINYSYIGSNIDIENYNSQYVYFKSINYYCDSSNYIGNIEEEPNCEYISTVSKFTIVLENNNLRIYNFEEIKNIVK